MTDGRGQTDETAAPAPTVPTAAAEAWSHDEVR